MSSRAAVQQALSAERSALIQEMVALLTDEVQLYQRIAPEDREAMVGRLVDVLLGALTDYQPGLVRSYGVGGYSRVEAQGGTFANVLSVTRVARQVFARKAQAVVAPEAAFEALARINTVCDDLLDAIGPLLQRGLDQTRAALGAMEARYEELFLRAPAMMYCTDADFRIVAVSDRWLEVLGYTREEVIGRRSVEFTSEEAGRRAREVNLPGVQRDGFVYGVPSRFIKKSGEVVDVLLSSVGLQSEPGDLHRMVVVLVDVTEQLRAERALRESEERYRGIVELAPVAILVQREGRIVFANPAAVHLTGAESAEALSGVPVLDLVHPEHRPLILERIRRIRERGGDAPPAEVLFQRLDGTSFLVEATARVVSYEGEPAVQVLLTDVTERRQVEDALRRTQAQEQLIRAQEELLRSLSAPLIPLGDGVVVMPLVGRVTAERAGQLVEGLVEGVAAQAAHTAIIDVTGVPEADTGVALALGRAARAIRLLGADVVLTGIQPAIARALVELGVELGGIPTRGTLRDGIAHALGRAPRARR